MLLLHLTSSWIWSLSRQAAGGSQSWPTPRPVSETWEDSIERPEAPEPCCKTSYTASQLGPARTSRCWKTGNISPSLLYWWLSPCLPEWEFILVWGECHQVLPVRIKCEGSDGCLRLCWNITLVSNQQGDKTHPVSWNVLDPAGSHLVHRHGAVPGSHSDTSGGETVRDLTHFPGENDEEIIRNSPGWMSG